MPKGSSWVLSNMCKHAAKNSGAPKSSVEEQTSIEEVQSAKPGPGSQIGAVCPSEKEVQAIHSYTKCPKAPHGSYLTCANMLQKIQVHPRVLWRSKRPSKRSKVPNLAQAAKSELFAP